jgi:capsular polysaccharide biosynthesis protein
LIKFKIFNSFISNRKKPVNLNIKDFDLFEVELEKKFDEVFVYELKNIFMSGEFVIFQQDTLPNNIKYHASFYSFKNNISFCKVILSAIFRFKFSIKIKKYFIFTDDWSFGYFHWLLDAIPRLYSIKINLNSNPSVILLAKYKNLSFANFSLKLMDIKNIKYLNSNSIYYFRKIIFHCHLAPTGNYNEENLISLRNYIINNNTHSLNLGPKIFISRSKAKRRNIINEYELLPILNIHGFKVVCFEDYTMEEQISICVNSSVLISQHGAGLSNMLFMPKNSKVAELRNEGDRHNNCYFSLASALNLDYYYLQCHADEIDVLNANFFVDISEFKNLLKLVLEEKFN